MSIIILHLTALETNVYENKSLSGSIQNLFLKCKKLNLYLKINFQSYSECVKKTLQKTNKRNLNHKHILYINYLNIDYLPDQF